MTICGSMTETACFAASRLMKEPQGEGAWASGIWSAATPAARSSARCGRPCTTPRSTGWRARTARSTRPSRSTRPMCRTVTVRENSRTKSMSCSVTMIVWLPAGTVAGRVTVPENEPLASVVKVPSTIGSLCISTITVENGSQNGDMGSVLRFSGAARNLPAAGSLSLTLDALTTVTTVRFDRALATDAMTLDGVAASAKVLARTTAWLDRVRALAGVDARAAIDTANHFPTASGLASSASGFAALALAATRAAGLDLDGAALSRLAREGSGSAARSIYGGLVRMHAGARADGDDAIATPVATAPAPM